MTTLTRRTALAIAAAALLAAPAGAAPAPAKPAPVFSATDTKGAPVDLAALRGKTVILE